MALERVPADIRAEGVARMSDPEIILKIMDVVTIPVMAKARIGHFMEAQILEALEIDYIRFPCRNWHLTSEQNLEVQFYNKTAKFGWAESFSWAESGCRGFIGPVPPPLRKRAS